MSGDAAADSGASAGGDGPPQGLQPGGTGENGEIVGGPRTPQQMMAQKRMQQTQAQVDSVVDIMRANVEKVLERDEKLTSLDERADALQQGAAQFEQQAGALKNKMWWKNMKMMIIMGVIGLVVVVIIAGPYLTGGKSGAEAPSGPSIAAGPSAVGTAGAGGTVAVPPVANQTPQSSSSSTNQQLNRLQQQ